MVAWCLGGCGARACAHGAARPALLRVPLLRASYQRALSDPRLLHLHSQHWQEQIERNAVQLINVSRLGVVLYGIFMGVIAIILSAPLCCTRQSKLVLGAGPKRACLCARLLLRALCNLQRCSDGRHATHVELFAVRRLHVPRRTGQLYCDIPRLCPWIAACPPAAAASSA